MKKGEPFYPAPAHGTQARYSSMYYGCRCKECRAGHAAYMRLYRERRRANYGKPLQGWW
jgi:hypothetical protein